MIGSASVAWSEDGETNSWHMPTDPSGHIWPMAELLGIPTVTHSYCSGQNEAMMSMTFWS